jgi:hypothetical protein
MALVYGGQAPGTVRGHDDVVSGPLEIEPEHIRDGRLVLDDEDEGAALVSGQDDVRTRAGSSYPVPQPS